MQRNEGKPDLLLWRRLGIEIAYIQIGIIPEGRSQYERSIIVMYLSTSTIVSRSSWGEHGNALPASMEKKH